MRRFIPLAALLLSLSVAATPALAQSCAPKLTGTNLVAAGKPQMAINPTLPPQQFVDEKGELRGLNVELGRALAAKLCLTAEFIRMDFPAMVPALRGGRFDTINTGMFWTDERSKLMFMVPYAQQTLGVFGYESAWLGAVGWVAVCSNVAPRLPLPAAYLPALQAVLNGVMAPPG